MHKAFNLKPSDGFVKIDKICRVALQKIGKNIGSIRNNIAFEAKHKTTSAKFIR